MYSNLLFNQQAPILAQQLQQPQEEYYHQSCIPCKRGHRKCDRKLNGCAYCKKTGKQCFYHESPQQLQHQQQQQQPLQQQQPSKKRKIEEVTEDYPVTTVSHVPQQQHQPLVHNTRMTSPTFNVHFNRKTSDFAELLSNKAIISEVMRSYFNVFTVGNPLIDVEHSNALIDQFTSLDKVHGDSALHVSPLQKSPTNNLVLLSIITFCLQRLGNKEMARQVYQYTAQMLSAELFVYTSCGDPLRDSNLASTLFTLAFYLVGEGGKHNEQARFYLHTLRYYLSAMTQDPRSKCVGQFKNRLIVIQKYVNLIDLALSKDDVAAALQVMGRLTKIFDTFCFHTSRSIMSYVASPDQPKEQVVEYLTSAKSAIDHIYETRSGFSAILNGVTRLSFRLMFNGLMVHTLIGDWDYNKKELIESANEITDDISSHYHDFTYCPSTVIHAISLAAKVHMRNNDLERSERDFINMKALSSQFEAVNEEYGSQLVELETWISKKQLEETPIVMPMSDAIFHNANTVDLNSLLEVTFGAPPSVLTFDSEGMVEPFLDESDLLAVLSTRE